MTIFLFSFFLYAEIAFYNEHYTVVVSDQTHPNTVVAKVEARTFPLKHIITYTLLSENLKQPSLFAINSRTGEILVSGKLDRVQMRNYLLEVEASFQVLNTSGESQRRSAKSFVLINVRGLQSDHALSFTHSSYHIRVPCNTSQNTTVYRVRTANSDNIGNTRTRYRFQKRLDYFYITHNGKIKVQRSLLLLCYLTPFKSFRATVIVRDTANIKRNAQALIQIVVTPPGQLSKAMASVAPDAKDTITRLQTLISGTRSEQQNEKQ